jgi:hypothetical protein
MPEGSTRKEAWRAWLYQIRGAARAAPFRLPEASIRISVTPKTANEILEALGVNEKAAHAIDCAGRPTRRLLLDGIVIEWLAAEARGGQAQ